MMTYNEVKEMIVKEIERLQNMKRSRLADNREYQMGKAAGMVVFAREAGIITRAEATDLHQEVLEELF